MVLNYSPIQMPGFQSLPHAKISLKKFSSHEEDFGLNINKNNTTTLNYIYLNVLQWEKTLMHIRTYLYLSVISKSENPC